MARWFTIVLHVLIALGGLAESIRENNPWPLFVSSAGNAALQSPLVTKPKRDRDNDVRTHTDVGIDGDQ